MLFVLTAGFQQAYLSCVLYKVFQSCQKSSNVVEIKGWIFNLFRLYSIKTEAHSAERHGKSVQTFSCKRKTLFDVFKCRKKHTDKSVLLLLVQSLTNQVSCVKVRSHRPFGKRKSLFKLLNVGMNVLAFTSEPQFVLTLWISEINLPWRHISCHWHLFQQSHFYNVVNQCVPNDFLSLF